MNNEWLLLISLVGIYSTVLIFYYFFDLLGLYCWTVLATIAANIEVMILVTAFGLEQTLGNILFASTFLVTDIISEVAGHKKAKEAVNIGIATSATFILVSQSWLLYTPNSGDLLFPHMQAVFSNTPRIMLSGLLVYALVQRFDVWAYYKWWKFTEKRCGNIHQYLWLRNNASTLVSQLLNAILFTFAAFWGTYDLATLLNITMTSYLIFIVTSLADTPAVYLARFMKERKMSKNPLSGE